MLMIRAIVRPEKSDEILAALMDAGFPAVTKYSVAGRGKQRGIKIGDITISDFEDNAGELLKGSSNSTVDITYIRQGNNFTTSIKRGAIDVKAVPFYKLIDQNNVPCWTLRQ